jgi:predicted lysophospholipase L1 biosynthesis ABC-type transport system permease subunit
VRRNTLLVDVAIALAIAGLVLVVAPGLAIVAILAVLALVVCAVSFAFVGWRRRRARYRPSRARRPPPRRSPPRTRRPTTRP